MTPVTDTVFNVAFQNALSKRAVAAFTTTVTGLTGTAPTVTASAPVVGVATDTINNLVLGLAPLSAGDVATGSNVIVAAATPGNITVIAQAGANSTATISGNLDLVAAVRTLTVNDGAAATDLSITSTISASNTTAAVTLTQPGTTEFGGSALVTYAGNTTVNEGTLILNKSFGSAILGTLTVGDGIGGPSADVVRYGAAATGDQIASPTTANLLTVNASGLLDLAGKSDTISGGINLVDAPSFSSQITTGAGTLTVGGNIVLTNPTAGQNYVPTSPPATIAGNLDLGGATRTIFVSDSLALEDLLISANISGNAASGLIISGTAAANNGRLILAGNNSYGGTTTINNLETVLRDGGRLSGTTAITINPAAPINTTAGSTLTLDNSGTNHNDRINNAATLTMAGSFAAPATFNYIGNAAGSSETFGAVTVNASSQAIFRSATTGAGTNLITSSNLIRGSNSFIDFVGVGDNLGTADNKLIFTGLGSAFLPFGTVITTTGASSLATHTLANGIAGATVKTSLNDPSLTATDVVVLTTSEVITTTKTIAGLIIAANNVTVSATAAATW